MCVFFFLFFFASSVTFIWFEINMTVSQCENFGRYLPSKTKREEDVECIGIGKYGRLLSPVKHREICFKV